MSHVQVVYGMVVTPEMSLSPAMFSMQSPDDPGQKSPSISNEELDDLLKQVWLDN